MHKTTQVHASQKPQHEEGKWTPSSTPTKISFVIDGCQERDYFSSSDSGYNTHTPGKAPYSEEID